MERSLEDESSRRGFLVLFGATAASASAILYTWLAGSPSSELGDEPGDEAASDGSGVDDAGDRGTSKDAGHPEARASVRGGVVTVEVVDWRDGDRLAIEYFGVSPKAAEEAVERGYSGDVVRVMERGDSDSLRLTELAEGTYVLAAESSHGGRREVVEVFQVE